MIELILLTKCPYCQATRKTSSLGKILCFSCGKKYPVFDKRESRSNIVKILKGNNVLLSQELYKRGIYGKRNTNKKK